MKSQTIEWVRPSGTTITTGSGKEVISYAAAAGWKRKAQPQKRKSIKYSEA